MRFLALMLAFVASVASAEVGFHFFDQSEAAFLGQYQNDVFEFLSPAGPKQQASIQGFTDKDIQDTAEDWSRGKWRPDIRTPMIVAQLQLCRNKAVMLCDFIPGIGVSSGFIIKNPHVIVATFHGVEDYVDLLKSNLGYSDVEVLNLNLPITLLDSQGQIVRSALPGLKPLQLLPRNLDKGLDLSVFDGAGFSATGIAFSQNPQLSQTSKLYAIGFPGQTESRAALGKQDAKLDTLAWTTGTFIGAEVLVQTIFMNYVYVYDLSNVLANPVFVTDLDGVGGLSGGVVVNDEGFAVAVVTNAVYSSSVDLKMPEAQLPPPQAVLLSNLLQALK